MSGDSRSSAQICLLPPRLFSCDSWRLQSYFFRDLLGCSKYFHNREELWCRALLPRAVTQRRQTAVARWPGMRKHIPRKSSRRAQEDVRLLTTSRCFEYCKRSSDAMRNEKEPAASGGLIRIIVSGSFAQLVIKAHTVRVAPKIIFHVGFGVFGATPSRDPSVTF